MCGLYHISCMDVVVIGYVCMIVILQGHHKGDESVNWDLKGFQKVSLLSGRGNMRDMMRYEGQCFLLFHGLNLSPAEGSSYLEDGVHDHRQRAVSRKFGYFEYIQTPTINVLNFLEN